MAQLQTVGFDLVIQTKPELVLGLQVDIVVVVVVVIVGRAPEHGSGSVVGVEYHDERSGSLDDNPSALVCPIKVVVIVVVIVVLSVTAQARSAVIVASDVPS